MSYLLRLIVIISFCFLFIQQAFAGESLRIMVVGVAGDALKNVQDRLAVEQRLYGKVLTTEDVRNFYSHADSDVQGALKPFGYFKARVQSHLSYQGDTWVAQFHIEPGPLMHITGIDVDVTGPGANNPVIRDFIYHFPVKVGDVLQTKPYEDAKIALFQLVNNEGYLKAVLTKKEIRVHLAQNTAVIILHMDTGPRYYFGSINFSPSPFASHFLEKYAEFHPGDPFSPKKALTFQQNLINSQYFREATVTPNIRESNNHSIPTDVKLDTYKAKQYKLGAGYGTLTGPRVLVGMNWRHIGDSGQHLTLLAKYSPVLKGLAAKYFIPGANPMTDQYTLGANIQEFAPQNGNSFSESISGAYVKMIHDWQHSFSINLLNERYTFNNQPRRNSHEFYPSYSLSHVVMDNMTDPHSGRMINFLVQGATENIFSTTSFVQGEVKGKYIFSPTDSSRVILRGDLGYTIVNDTNQLPLTLQYLAGGFGSVRGYHYGSIGPGRYLEIASAEYQHRIVDKLYGAIFYDFGGATNQFNQGLKRGDGIGMVYASPIGPVQLYLTRAESKSWKPKSIIFNIGADF